MPGPDGRRPRPVRRLRCEACLDVLTLRHAWDTATCSCGALMMWGRPTKPVVHWRSGPGGGWTEVDDEVGTPAVAGADPVTSPPPAPTPAPPPPRPGRRLGYGATAASRPDHADGRRHRPLSV